MGEWVVVEEEGDCLRCLGSGVAVEQQVEQFVAEEDSRGFGPPFQALGEAVHWKLGLLGKVLDGHHIDLVGMQHHKNS